MNKPSRVHAFTLIELLVVIGVIAIIAAILFPVFAHARENARRTTCLSNVKEVDLANLMYAQDYDETLPTLTRVFGVIPVITLDFPAVLQPYIKNTQIFYCPDNTQTGCYADRSLRCMGVGYNWGPIQHVYKPGGGGGGLLVELPQTGFDHVGVYAGVPIATILAPADTFAFGDTQSDPFYTISADPCCESSGSTNSALIHSGMFNISYVDGHAKSMNWHAGISSVIASRFIVAPRNTADQGKWCADPTAEIESPLGKLPCGQVVPAIVAAGVKWFGD